MDSLSWEQTLTGLAVVIVALVVGRLGARLLNWIGQQTASQKDDRYWAFAGWVWWLAVALSSFSFLLRTLGIQLEPLRTVGKLSELLGVRGVAGLLILALAILAYQAIPRLIGRLAQQGGEGAEFTRERVRMQTLKSVLESGLRVLVLVLGGIFFLSNLGFNVTALLAAAGVAGLAISFAAQNLFRDLINGFFILLEDQFGVGDVITVGQLSGSVERFNLRITVLRDIDGKVHFIPNSQITQVTVMSRDWARALVDVSVAYGTDIDRAIAVITDEAQRLYDDPEWHDRFTSEGVQVLGVQQLADSGIVIRVLLNTKPKEQWAIGREFRRRIKVRLDQENIEIPFPQTKIWLEKPPA